jgi:hypothetical protein
MAKSVTRVAGSGSRVACLGERTGLESQVQNLVDRRNLLVRGRVQDDDDGANQANGTANLAQEAELFVEEVCAEDSADEDREGAEGGDEDGGRKGVGGKVEDLAEDHCDDAGPPGRVAQVRVAVAVEAMLLHGGIEALFGNDEAGADCERRRHGQHQADIPVEGVSVRVGGGAGAQKQRTCLRPWCRGVVGVGVGVDVGWKWEWKWKSAGFWVLGAGWARARVYR